MGFDFSELDAQLATLGSVRNDILQTARRLAGDTRSLAEVDKLLSSLASNVNVNLGAPKVSAPRAQPKVEASVPAREQNPAARPVPQLVSPAPAPVSERPAGVKAMSEAPQPPAATPPASLHPQTDTPAAAERSGPPHSEEIALPDPVLHDPTPRSGELKLDDPAPRSGSFALDPLPSDTNLDEDTDADFEAEFAALSAPDKASTKAKSIRPSAKAESIKAPKAESIKAPEAESIKPAAKAESIKAAAKAESIKAAAKAPEPIKAVSADDEETDAVLALFDAAENAPESIPAPAASNFGARVASPAPALDIGGLSDELEPSLAPPPGSRDPDAEFDALFDEASSPSNMPSTPAPAHDQDSVDDLLRDLGSPRVPQDLAKAAQAAAAQQGEDEDPTGIFDMSAFDAVTGGDAVAKPAQATADDDFEIEMDMDEVVEDEVVAKKPPPVAAKSLATPPRPPPQPPAPPGGVEKRPSFLGRLFGGNPKDSPDNK